jgi:hypothetical protein
MRYEKERLELVEQTIRRVAAGSDPDLELLARLDRLRTRLRQEVRSSVG